MSVCMFYMREDVDDNDDDDDKASKKILQHKGESPRQSKTDCSFKIKISEKTVFKVTGRTWTRPAWSVHVHAHPS